MYEVEQTGPTEYQIVELAGDHVDHVAYTSDRETAEDIADALNRDTAHAAAREASRVEALMQLEELNDQDAEEDEAAPATPGGDWRAATPAYQAHQARLTAHDHAPPRLRAVPCLFCAALPSKAAHCFGWQLVGPGVYDEGRMDRETALAAAAGPDLLAALSELVDATPTPLHNARQREAFFAARGALLRARVVREVTR